MMAKGRTGRLLPALGAGGLAATAILCVIAVTYLPHMQTLEGRVNILGGVEEPGSGNPYVRLADVYRGWANGTRDDYEYPMHVDDDVHWVHMAAIQRADSLRFPQPYTGAPAGETSVTLRGLLHERGFHLAFAQFQELTGLPFILIIRFIPALFAGLTASLVWASLRPWPGAPLAAAFVALVPSSPRFLGTAFFVPIGIGLAWIAATFVLARWGVRGRTGLPLLLLTVVWAFFIHLIVGFACLLVVLGMAPTLASRRRVDAVRVAGLSLAVLAFLYAAFRGDIEREADVMGFLPTDFTIFDQVGLPFLAAWAIGCALLTILPPPADIKTPITASAITSVVALGFIVVNHAFDLRLYILYDRWHQVFVLCAAAPAAYGIVAAAQWLVHGGRDIARRVLAAQGKRWTIPWAAPTLAALLAVGTAGAAAGPGLDGHLDEPYYYFMTDDVWHRFQAAQTLGPEYDVYLVHPWQAPIFNALTGKRPHVWLDPGSPPVRGADYEAFFLGRYSDDVWLVERDITVLFEVPGNPGAHYQPGPAGTYLLDPTYAQQVHAIRTEAGIAGQSA